jgi:hypothetical protein
LNFNCADDKEQFVNGRLPRTPQTNDAAAKNSLVFKSPFLNAVDGNTKPSKIGIPFQIQLHPTMPHWSTFQQKNSEKINHYVLRSKLLTVRF